MMPLEHQRKSTNRLLQQVRRGMIKHTSIPKEEQIVMGM